MGAAFKRMYVDLPADMHAQMKQKCAEQNKSQAVYIRELIQANLEEGNVNRGKQKSK